ncbi:LysR family transcriptional regulator [uncultured Roseobacter sp.]|uniref:LysR family transcriptional regulator n=1 Tax=uncultured Roseobacter sp. TaxID=114847 RepID=UPI002631FA56|nr:LysR family transcriptional regulator [uncultured Roseobacter sp.]
MPMRFTLRQLEYFVAVCEEGSIAAASARVNVSSPSISAAISQLEAEFSLPLFVRKHAHGLSLTETGRQFLDHAARVLAEARLLNQLADTISGKVQGPLRIGCLLTFAQVLLPAIRRKFAAIYPDVQAQQIEADQPALIDKLRRAEIDLALSYDLEIPPDLDFLPLRALPPYAMLAADHPLADRAGLCVEDLLDHPMVLLDLPLSSDYFLSFFDAAKTRPRIVERTRDMAVMRSLVANGFGFGIANIRPQSDLSPDGRALRFVPLRGDLRPMRLGLILPPGARKVLTISAFVDHTEKTVADWGFPGVPLAKPV